jgi:hypothetical protein
MKKSRIDRDAIIAINGFFVAEAQRIRLPAVRSCQARAAAIGCALCK